MDESALNFLFKALFYLESIQPVVVDFDAFLRGEVFFIHLIREKLSFYYKKCWFFVWKYNDDFFSEKR